MAPLHIYLARHGQTAANAEGRLQGSGLNPPLNERGERQAAALAAALKNDKMDWVITSALERAIQTGNAVAKHHPGAPVLSDARLNEISWGKLDGLKARDTRPMTAPVGDAWSCGDFDAKVPGGESASECKARVMAAFADILRTARERQYRRIFLCLHGGILRVVMAALVDKDLSQMGKFSHANCSYTVIMARLDDSAPEIDPEQVPFLPNRYDIQDHLAGL
ncbi:hypothetical protein H4R18_005358 [Coemansia javaensis]|uniref:Phosphoglycerate mutase n=1 Tax=Coemansia javaensis TaxID=2761396 RepID=A0A9W8LEF7_9FUNG|nr:hypothetical protein H4R18_005358 [Coemansia javaensis]